MEYRQRIVVDIDKFSLKETRELRNEIKKLIQKGKETLIIETFTFTPKVGKQIRFWLEKGRKLGEGNLDIEIKNENKSSDIRIKDIFEQTPSKNALRKFIEVLEEME